MHAGLGAGLSDAFTLTLTAANGGGFGPQLDISNLGIKFQGCRECGPEVFDDVSGPGSAGPTAALDSSAVPWPTPLILVGVAILGRLAYRGFTDRPGIARNLTRAG